MNHYINLSSYNLTSDEEDFLNLGFNFQFEPKYCKIKKEAKIEWLYQNLLRITQKRSN